MAAQSAKHDPKMAPQNDPKSIKYRCQKMIEILIEKKRFLGASWAGPAECAGLLGDYRGGKNSLFEICRCLRHIMALRFGDLAFASAFGSSVWHALLRPSGAGGGLTSPRGITAARPPFLCCDLGQGLWDTSTSAILCVFDAFWEPLGAILESLEPS